MANPTLLQHALSGSAEDLEHRSRCTLFLRHLAERGGEIEWPRDWQSNARVPPAGRAVAQDLLGEVSGPRGPRGPLVQLVEYVTHAGQTHGVLKIRLTDLGRDVVAQLDQRSAGRPVVIHATA